MTVLRGPARHGDRTHGNAKFILKRHFNDVDELLRARLMTLICGSGACSWMSREHYHYFLEKGYKARRFDGYCPGSVSSIQRHA